MFNVTERRPGSYFNNLRFNIISVFDLYPQVSLENIMSLVYDLDIVPTEYIGEQHYYANSPWMPLEGFYPMDWVMGTDGNLYFASADGYVYQYGVGHLDHQDKIDTYYVSPSIDFGVPDRVKRLRWIEFDAQPIKNSLVRVWYRLDNEEEWAQLCEINSGEIVYPYAKFPRPAFRRMQLKFENAYSGCNFIIHAYSLDVVIRGQQKEMI